jgi:dihydrolipoamide dehydrogenase
MPELDVVIIGAGSGGYVCAIRASQLGLKTVLVEKDGLGGECLQAGCIPSKALITVGRLVKRVKNAQNLGVKVAGLEIDVATLQSWKASIITNHENGIASLCKGYGIEIVRGEAAIIDRNRVVVRSDSETHELLTKNIVIATGSRAVALPGLDYDGKLVISSREALSLPKVPDRLLVVGGGYIGLELASVYQNLGSKIFVVEVMEQLLPGTETDLVRLVQRNLEKGGAQIRLKSQVTSIEKRLDSIKATVQTPQGTETIEADKLLLSVGRKPATTGLNLEKIGVLTDEKGFIKTDARMKTNVEGIYAIGDVRGPPLLAHKASAEGIVAAESISGLDTVADWKAMPFAIFTEPEIAGVGMTEKQAIEAGHKVKKSRFPFAALGRASVANESEGFVRIVSDAERGTILGVQIVGPEASDLISEVALAIEMGASVEDIAHTVHPHPTFPESLKEAAEVAAGRPVHIRVL